MRVFLIGALTVTLGALLLLCGCGWHAEQQRLLVEERKADDLIATKAGEIMVLSGDSARHYRVLGPVKVIRTVPEERCEYQAMREQAVREFPTTDAIIGAGDITCEGTAIEFTDKPAGK